MSPATHITFKARTRRTLAWYIMALAGKLRWRWLAKCMNGKRLMRLWVNGKEAPSIRINVQ